MNFIFDLYGTLVDVWTDESRDELWEGVASLIGDGEERAESVRREYTSLCGSKKKGEYHEIDMLSVFEDMLSARGVDVSVAPSLALEFRRLSMVWLRTFDEVKEMLTELKEKGCGVFLLSNAQSCFTIDELKITGLYDLFDGIVISSDIGVKKPSPQAFDIALKRFNITAEGSVYVGNDMRDDVLGATKSGIRTVYIHTEQSGNYPDMDIPEPTFTVKSHLEMCRLLTNMAEGCII